MGEPARGRRNDGLAAREHGDERRDLLRAYMAFQMGRSGVAAGIGYGLFL